MEYETTLKAAILGTEDYHVTMRQIADNSLRRMMVYVPPQLNVDSLDNSLPTVHPGYLQQANLIMQKLAGDNGLIHCNPRSPYLTLAWLLVGLDNEYRICQHFNHVNIPKRLAIVHICIALGDTPSISEIQDATRAAREKGEDANSVVWNAIFGATRAAFSSKTSWPATAKQIKIRLNCSASAALSVAKTADRGKGADGVAMSAIFSKARQWAHISDEEALQIAHQLTLDILSL